MATNASKHISVPKTFSTGDVDEWFCRFEICCKANEWNGVTKAAKLPTLLEGEALAAWLKLSEEDKEDYVKAKKAIKSKLLPPTFTALEKFNGRSMLPGETLPLFIHDLKRLLDQAMLDLPNEAREQLLLHRFLAGLPSAISKQICSAGDTRALDMTVERVRLLMTIERDLEQTGVALISQEDQYYKQNATYGQNTVLLYHWQRAGRTKLKTMLFHYFHKPHLWNSQASSVEFPECRVGNLQAVVCEFQQLFETSPGRTDALYHYIPTTGPPVCVPPRRIPIHYRDEVLKQLQSM